MNPKFVIALKLIPGIPITLIGLLFVGLEYVGNFGRLAAVALLEILGL